MAPRQPYDLGAARFWVPALCVAARWAPWFVRAVRSISVMVAWAATPRLRAMTIANARGLLGGSASDRECARVGKGIVGSFHDFIFELARLSHLTPADARKCVSQVSGQEHYSRARAEGRGVIVVTAHMGSFEVALATLAEIEPRLHVVFRRDEIAQFEQARASFRARLGVHECSIDEGLAMWAGLSDALRQGDTVLVQGDRVVDGQPGAVVRFGAGRIRVPRGPAKLARLTGAPLVPAVSMRDSRGRIEVLLDPLIAAPTTASEDEAVLQKLADSLSGFVLRRPSQWLTLQRAFLDDAEQEPS